MKTVFAVYFYEEGFYKVTSSLHVTREGAQQRAEELTDDFMTFYVEELEVRE